jgi:hypothetical protein
MSLPVQHEETPITPVRVHLVSEVKKPRNKMFDDALILNSPITKNYDFLMTYESGNV